MKQKLMYGCDFCDAVFVSKSDCQKHEAEHMGLHHEDYLKLRMLSIAAADAVARRCINNNPHTRRDEDIAVQAYVDFIEAHHIDDNSIPNDFT